MLSSSREIGLPLMTKWQPIVFVACGCRRDFIRVEPVHSPYHFEYTGQRARCRRYRHVNFTRERSGRD